MQAADTRAYIDRALLIAARTVVLLVLVTPLVVTRDAFFPFVVGKALYSRVLIELAFAVWIVLAVRNASYRPVASRLMIAFAIYLVVSLIASFAGVSLQRSIWSTYERMQGIVDLTHWLAFLLVLTSVFRTRQDWRHVLNLSLLVGVVMALMGAAVMAGLELPVYDFLEAGQRVTLTLGNPTYVGVYMLINALIGTGLLLDSFTDRTSEGQGSAAVRRRRPRRRTRSTSAGTASTLLWWRVFWIAAIALSLWMMLESSTRGAFVGLVGALVAASVGYLLWGRLGGVKIAAAAVIVGISAFGLFLVLGAETSVAQRLAERSYVVERFIQAGQGTDTSLQGRLASVSFGLQGFIERPLLGWGPENYVVAWGRHYDAEEIGDYRGPPFDQAHNKPIEELTTKGVAGLASYLSLWVLMLWIVSSRIRRLGADREVLTLVMGAAMVGYFAQNLFLFDTATTVLQFVILLGFAVSLDTTYDGVKNTCVGIVWPRSVGTAVDRLHLRDLAAQVARRPFAGWAGAALLTVAVVVTVYLVNVRVYQAAVEANSAVVRRGPSWTQRLDHFERSISLFPPLANYTRQYMLTSFESGWDALLESALTPRVVDMAGDAAVGIEATEPEWWEAYVNLAAVYQRAAALDPSYAKEARAYAATAERLAPETLGVAVIKDRQGELEEALRSQ